MPEDQLLIASAAHDLISLAGRLCPKQALKPSHLAMHNSLALFASVYVSYWSLSMEYHHTLTFHLPSPGDSYRYQSNKITQILYGTEVPAKCIDRSGHKAYNQPLYSLKGEEDPSKAVNWENF